MGNTENLKSYKKGQSGNPGGRPPGSRNVSTVLANMLREVAPDVVVEASFIKDISKGLKSVTIADAAAARIVYQGIVKGDPWALRELLDRTEGKAKERIQITNRDDLDAAAEMLNRLIASNREDFELYGKPMPDEGTLDCIIFNLAEQYDVNEKELRDRIGNID